MSCCCVGSIGAKMGTVETQNFVTECQVTTYLYQSISHDTDNVYTVPENGHYVTYITATGGDVKNALFHATGTELHIEYLRAGQQIPYSLGDVSTAVFPSGYRLEATKREGSYIEPLIAFQNLGDITSPATVTNTFGGGYMYPSTLNSVAGFPVSGIVPSSADINYLNTGQVSFQYWAVAEIDFPETGVYTFGSTGDDYAHLFLDGVPIIMTAKDAGRAINTRPFGSGGIAEVEVTAGKHFVYLWNLSNICCHIHSGMFIKDAQGNKIAASDNDTNWKYIRSPINCLDEIRPEVLLPQPYVSTPL